MRAGPISRSPPTALRGERQTVRRGKAARWSTRPDLRLAIRAWPAGWSSQVEIQEGFRYLPASQAVPHCGKTARPAGRDRKSTRLNSSHVRISYAVFCLKKKKNK